VSKDQRYFICGREPDLRTSVLNAIAIGKDDKNYWLPAYRYVIFVSLSKREIKKRKIAIDPSDLLGKTVILHQIRAKIWARKNREAPPHLYVSIILEL
jgi:hypothetical protein